MMNNSGDLHAEARDHHRKLQRSQNAKTEFTALVQIPKNVENGPLLVKDTKKSFISFVAPNEQGYKVCSDISMMMILFKFRYWSRKSTRTRSVAIRQPIFAVNLILPFRERRKFSPQLAHRRFDAPFARSFSKN